MIIVLNDVYLEVKSIDNMYYNTHKTNVTTWNFSTWWNPMTWRESTIITKYKLTINYTHLNNHPNQFTITNEDKSSMANIFKKIVEQCKLQCDAANQELVDKMFENALNDQK